MLAHTASAWWQWFVDHDGLLAWMFVLSIGSLVLVAVLLPVVVVRLPADYFSMSRREAAARRGVLAWLWRLAKNGLGFVFVLAGIAMLFLPGQGLLTILIGLLLLDFPGKRAAERRLIQRPAIRGFLDRLRQRRGQPPFLVD